MLLLGDLDVPLLDVSLEALHFLFLFLELVDQVVQFLLQELVLGLGVEVVNSDSGDLVGDVFDLYFFLGDVIVGVLGLLD